jgi:2-polyprenyl-3-methyl-5-hydroxy-6-metoxy-1,4-benzoquinol methylase
MAKATDAKANTIVKDGYNRMGNAYHTRRVAKTEVNYQFLDGLAHYLPSQGKVLDLGCGSGVPISKYFAEHGYDVTGIDISETMIALAKENVPQSNFFVQNITEASFELLSFDLIVSFFAIIHVPRANHAGLFNKMSQWLNNDGVALLTLGATDSEEDVVDDWGGVSMYWSHFNTATNLRLLREAGFELVWSEEEERPNDGKHLYVVVKKVG